MLLNNLKALAIVLALSGMIFALAKPICLRYMEEPDFARRRNVWIALTLVAFLSPSFWLFVLIAIPLLAWSASKDTNIVALYMLMLHVVPPIGLEIPMVGVNKLFELNNYRILALAILAPAAWRIAQEARQTRSAQVRTMDRLLIAYACLQLVLLIPYETFTHTMRRGYLISLDTLLLYFVVSRTCTTRRAIADAMASVALAGAILAAIAVFENLKHWLLYAGIGEQWGDPILFAYLFRAGALRAQASAGHSIGLGYILAIAFGFWLYLGLRDFSPFTRAMVAGLLWAGLLATYSRAPWFVAVAILMTFSALGSQGVQGLRRPVAALGLLAVAIFLSPFGDRVLDVLPFIGTVDAETVTYRQELALRAWDLVQQNPLLGNPFVLLELEELRQGQGIIDLMNTYATVAMFHGLIGLALFLLPFLIGLGVVLELARRNKASDADLSLMGGCLTACMVGTLLMMATGSFGTGLEKMFYILAGLAAGYRRAARQTLAASVIGQVHRAWPG